jgi:hypothetical protein
LALARENHKMLTDDASLQNQNTPPESSVHWADQKKNIWNYIS